MAPKLPSQVLKFHTLTSRFAPNKKTIYEILLRPLTGLLGALNRKIEGLVCGIVKPKTGQPKSLFPLQNKHIIFRVSLNDLSIGFGSFGKYNFKEQDMPKQGEKTICKECRFFEPKSENPNLGECHIHPPTVVVQHSADMATINSAFPYVDPGNWCNDWRQNT